MSSSSTSAEDRPSARDRLLRGLKLTALAVAAETVAMKVRGYQVGLKAPVRCRRGHLFTTIWIPGVSVKSVRLGVWRIQYCPVGHHWALVQPVKTAKLTDEDRRIASEHRDIRLP
jgi:hypothetical protein